MFYFSEILLWFFKGPQNVVNVQVIGDPATGLLLIETQIEIEDLGIEVAEIQIEIEGLVTEVVDLRGIVALDRGGMTGMVVLRGAVEEMICLQKRVSKK